METIPYRNTRLLIKTIPKGTLLFRILRNPENDFRGVPLEDGTRCIVPTFNVYFYPNPFAAEITFAKYLEQDYDSNIYAYILTKDVKLLSLVAPSRYTRLDKSRKRTFIKRCSTVKKGCLPKAMNEYDACFSKTMIEKHPSIVGYIGIPFRDSISLKKGLKDPKNKRYLKYFQFTSDNMGTTGVPEIAMYPLTKREPKDVIVKESDKLENNYKILKVFHRNDKKSIMTFMDDHAVFDPSTFYYTYKA